ncbi:MAG TPA: fumarylacetoacetate hydrolase family protein [Streptosporangiaceae bacterium]|jgi:2-keto-4-pentenoate hydratase|nr:fumarylacetoacetate hydrolase family protein [Streptosporangiaceae bacterium]
MPLTDAEARQAADDLYQARQTGVPIAPLTARHPGMDMADGYRVQQELVARLTADGDRVAGYKLGLTSAPMQQLMGVDSPDFAPVLASHLHPDGAAVAAGSFIAPRVEAEIALVLRADLAGPDCTTLDVAAAVSGAVAALEIVDSRIADWKIALADTIADLASSGAVVLGPSVTPADGLDLRLAGMVLTCNGSLIATGAGAAALGSPLQAVAWLVRTLHPLGGGLRAGQFVMTGALHAAVNICPGQNYRAEFDRLGPVRLRVR